MKLRDLMTKNVRTCRPDSPVTEAAQIMADVNCGAVPVCEGDKCVGMITDRDIVLRVVAKGEDFQTVTVRDCMTTPVITATPDTSAQDAAEIMANKQIRRLPIVEGNRLCGIVALGDMATVRIHVDEAGQALSNISEPAQPGAH